ncbi:hypothetical protein [Psychromonas ossibalaenae]|uniref:hypothetical protein n=1 Tax=Psychromonas ossibalaenae TaxID=444922 RepID=UPI0003692638|nr:hypothetical protein [Psychromonas ossibalaenae]
MKKIIRMIFGMPLYDRSEYIQFSIKPKMVNPDVVRMDMESFRNSKNVQKQAAAAMKNLQAK